MKKTKLKIKHLNKKIYIFLHRLRDLLHTESVHTTYMLEIYYKHLRKEATKEELKLANIYFQEILKTIGVGTLAVLPVAFVTIPVLVFIAKKFNINLLPNSFSEWKKNASKYTDELKKAKEKSKQQSD